MTFKDLFNGESESVSFLEAALERVAPTIVCSDAFYDGSGRCFTALISDDDELVTVFVSKQDGSYAVEVSFDEDEDTQCSDIYTFLPSDDVEEALAKAL